MGGVGNTKASYFIKMKGITERRPQGTISSDCIPFAPEKGILRIYEYSQQQPIKSSNIISRAHPIYKAMIKVYLARTSQGQMSWSYNLSKSL